MESSHSGPAVDIDSLRAEMTANGVGAIVDQLLQIYAEDAPGDFAKIGEAVAGGDLAETARWAHSLKSASRNIRALALGDALEELEKSALAGDTGAVGAQHARVVDEYERAMAELAGS